MPSVNRGYTYNIKLGYLIQKYFLDQETLSFPGLPGFPGFKHGKSYTN